MNNVPAAHTRLLAALLCALFAIGCEVYDGPPRPAIVGLEDGFLADPGAPVALAFHEPIDVQSLSVKIIVFKTNGEGELADVDGDSETELEILYEYMAPHDFEDRGAGTLDDSRTLFTIVPDARLPLGPQLALLIEPGLQDDAGHRWEVRQVLKFGYQLECTGEAAPTAFPSGGYFFNIAVDAPVTEQILLWSRVRVDPLTGRFVGQFTRADRDPKIDCNEYGLACTPTEACRTLPTPACVLPSEDAGTSDEYTDFYANNAPPIGFSFTASGCIVDQPDGTFRVANKPVDVKMASPPVTVKGINLSALWGYDDEGVLRGSGTFHAQVQLGGDAGLPGKGSHEERLVLEDEVPDIPPPPAE